MFQTIKRSEYVPKPVLKIPLWCLPCVKLSRLQQEQLILSKFWDEIRSSGANIATMKLVEYKKCEISEFGIEKNSPGYLMCLFPWTAMKYF